MEILVLRTFAHPRIWEGKESTCHYEGTSLEIIRAWEPNLLNHNLAQIRFAIGIYIEQYFTYTDPSGQRAFTGTLEEQQPSLLELNPMYPGATAIGIDNGHELRIAFRFIEKFPNFTRQEMIRFDRSFVNAKKKAIGPNLPHIPYDYDSLCFTINLKSVEMIQPI
jgi:hypothetical protein